MAGRYIDVVVRLNSSQFDRGMKTMGTEAEATAAKTNAAFRRSQAAIMNTGHAAQSLGRMMTGVGLGLGAVGYVAVKSAVTFQTAMTRIQTQAGASAKQVDSMSKAVLKLGGSGQVQYGPTELANALYHIQSVAAGTYPALRHTSTAMAALKVAAQGAAVGGSDLEQTTTALMGALFATRQPLSALPKMMGLLNATVGVGNMRMDDLVQALGRGVIPAFQQTGLKATDAFAALALFSDSGVKAASSAAQVSTALHFLVQPSAKADKFLGAIGMNSIQMATDLHKPKGLLVALRDLAKGLGSLKGGLTGVDAGQVTAAILPGGRGRILLTALQNLDRYGGKLDAIYLKEAQQQAAVKAQSQTMSGKLHTAWAIVQTDLTKFGITLLPIVAKDLPFFAHGLEAILRWFTKLPKGVKEFLGILTPALLIGGPIMIGLGKMIVLFGKLWGAIRAVKVMMFGLRAAGIAAGVGEAAAAAGGVGAAAAASATAAGVGGVGAANAAWRAQSAAITAAHAAPAEAAQASKGLRILTTLGKVAGAASMAGTAIEAGILIGDLLPGKPGSGVPGRGAATLNQARLNRYGGAMGGLVTPHGIRHMMAGGPNSTDNVPAWLAAGEGVVTRAGMSGIGGAGGLAAINNGGIGNGLIIQPAPVNIYLDGRIIARAVLRQTLNKAARGPSSLVGGQLVTGGR